MSNELIKLDSVCKRYGHIKAIDDVNLSLGVGEFLSVFGSNGAGKSTLLKVISYQTRLTSGDILYAGVSNKKVRDEYKAHFGVISHQSFLYENLSALENLEFYGTLYGVKNVTKKSEELLKKVDLFARRNDPVRGFSRGMLQRVSIVRALIHSPSIIFLDEPYTGLDAVASQILTNLLKEQLSANKTIIMVTHDLRVGLELASKVIIMKSGKIVYDQNKSNINLADFESEYLKYAGDIC